MLARALAVLIAACAGVGVGVLGAFVQSISFRALGVSVAIGVLIAVAGLGGLLVLTGTVLRSRLPVLGPALGWVIGVFPLAVPRPEGDLVVAGTLSGYVFLLGGALLIGVCMSLPFDTRPPDRPAAAALRGGLTGSLPRSAG